MKPKAKTKKHHKAHVMPASTAAFSPVLTITITTDGMCIADSGITAQLGYPDFKNRHITDIIPHLNLTCLSKPQKEKKCYAQDGTVTIIDVILKPLRNTSQLSCEITQIESPSDYLKKLERNPFITAVLINAKVGFTDWIVNEKLMLRNNTFLNLLGYSQEEVDCDVIFLEDIIFPEERESLYTYFNNLSFLSTESSPEKEIRLRHKRGTPVWFLHRATVLERDNGVPIRILNSYTDITELKQREQNTLNNLQISESKFTDTFNNAAIGLNISSLDGTYLNVNQALCNIVGYSKQELLTMDWQSITHPDDLHEDLQLFHETITGKRNHYSMIKRYYHKDGQLIWIHLSVSIVRDTDETPLFLIGQVKDITAIKDKEQELTVKNKRLERIKNNLEQFAYVATHDLRTPLVNIQAFLNYFDESELKAAENKTIFHEIKENIKALEDTLNDLIQVVRLSRPAAVPNTILRFEDMFNEVTDILKDEIITSSAKVTCHFDCQEIRYSKRYLKSILQNLLTNALKYRSPKRKPLIHVSTKETEDHVRLSIKDNGIGIDLKSQESKIFQIFKRANFETEGKGVGLYLVKSQVEHFGGHITVESELDNGSTFHIFLKNSFHDY